MSVSHDEACPLLHDAPQLSHESKETEPNGISSPLSICTGAAFSAPELGDQADSVVSSICTDILSKTFATREEIINFQLTPSNFDCCGSSVITKNLLSLWSSIVDYEIFQQMVLHPTNQRIRDAKRAKIFVMLLMYLSIPLFFVLDFTGIGLLSLSDRTSKELTATVNMTATATATTLNEGSGPPSLCSYLVSSESWGVFLVFFSILQLVTSIPLALLTFRWIDRKLNRRLCAIVSIWNEQNQTSLPIQISGHDRSSNSSPNSSDLSNSKNTDTFPLHFHISLRIFPDLIDHKEPRPLSHVDRLYSDHYDGFFDGLSCSAELVIPVMWISVKAPAVSPLWAVFDQIHQQIYHECTVEFVRPDQASVDCDCDDE